MCSVVEDFCAPDISQVSDITDGWDMSDGVLFYATTVMLDPFYESIKVVPLDRLECFVGAGCIPMDFVDVSVDWFEFWNCDMPF